MHALARLLSGLVLLTVACQEGAGVRRLLAEQAATPLVALTAREVTRPGLRVHTTPGSPKRIDLGALGRGTLEIHLAPAAGRPRTIEAALSLRGAQDVEIGECVLTWPAHRTKPRWKPCTVDVTRDVSAAQLVLASSTQDVDWLLADPHWIPQKTVQRPDLFLVVVDTARADLLRPRPETGERSGLRRLAQDGLVFENARSTSSWTRPAIASLLTGIGARGHRVLGRTDVLGTEVVTLGEVLQAAGYQTWATSTNPNVLPMWGLAQGFDVFIDAGALRWFAAKTDGRLVFHDLGEALEARSEVPGFFYVHLMDPHHPYAPRTEHLRQARNLAGVRQSFPGGSPQQSSGVFHAYLRYVGELLDVDEQLGRFLERLVSLGLYDDALIVVVADHGEEFADHDGRGHAKTLYEEVVRVPLVIKPPRGTSTDGIDVAGLVGIEDVMPTILDLLDLPGREGLDGRSVRGGPPRAQHLAVLHVDGHELSSLVEGSWKLIVDHEAGARRLYDLATDPRERLDRFDSEPERAARLERMATAESALAEQGWHLRGCGGPEASVLRWRLSAPGHRARAALFEPKDELKVDETSGRIEVAMHLDPYQVLAKADQAVSDVPAPDQDEVVVVPGASARDAGGLVLEARGGGTLQLRMGGEAELRPVRELDLSTVQAEARFDSRGFTSCATGPNEPHLKVWYVRPPESLAEEAVDPTVRERLRALGYAH